MNSFKKLFAVAALATCAAAPVMAQSADEAKAYKPFPYIFVGVQGGAQTTFTDYDNTKLITPTTSLSLGAWFTPVVGARLHVNGLWNQGGFKNSAIDEKYDYKYATTDLDVMLNLVNLFGKKDSYPVAFNLIGGIGLNTAWNNDQAYALKNVMPLAWKGTRLSHNARVGAQVAWNASKLIDVNFEVAANSLSDRYNSKVCEKDDWSVYGQLGLAFKFGYRPAEPPAEEWATRIDTIWYDEDAYTPRVEGGTISWNVFYEIRESDYIDADQQLAKIGAFLKDHRECKVSIKSYADAQTGNPKINMGYSQQRSEKAVDALVAAGVSRDIITAEYFGDTVQPFSENDKNRVSIITATGLKDVKDKYTVKKFRTEEVRYRVK